MHGIGRVAGANDGFSGIDLDAPAIMHQRARLPLGAENLGEPVAQAGFFLFGALVLGGLF